MLELQSSRVKAHLVAHRASVIQHPRLMLPGYFAEQWRNSFYWKLEIPPKNACTKWKYRQIIVAHHPSFGGNNEARRFLWGVFGNLRAAFSALTPLALHYHAPITQVSKKREKKALCIGTQCSKSMYDLITRIHNSDKNKNVQGGPSYRGWAPPALCY